MWLWVSLSSLDNWIPATLAVAGIQLSSDDKDTQSHIRMAHVKVTDGLYELVSDEQITSFTNTAKEKYPHDKN